MTAITEEWVLFWYQCLSENFDYTLYCSAREKGDEDLCKDYASRFERIAEIYEDFGTLGGWPPKGLDDPWWKRWFSEHKHLFMPDVQQLTPPTEIRKVEADTIVLSLPLQPTIDATLAALRDHLTSVYRSRPAPKVASPKYGLNHTKDGRVAVGYERVRQAVHMSSVSYIYNSEDGEQLGVHKAMIQFLKHEIDALGWSLDPKARRRLEEENYLEPERFKNFKRRMNDCRQDMQALSQNTIRGVFPDITPYQSKVIDQFEGG